jgi:hypothetical protein
MLAALDRHGLEYDFVRRKGKEGLPKFAHGRPTTIRDRKMAAVGAYQKAHDLLVAGNKAQVNGIKLRKYYLAGRTGGCGT